MYFKDFLGVIASKKGYVPILKRYSDKLSRRKGPTFPKERRLIYASLYHEEKICVEVILDILWRSKPTLRLKIRRPLPNLEMLSLMRRGEL